jgi:beta-barrel assembly-enhancing protease
MTVFDPRIVALLLAITLVSVKEEIEIGTQADRQVRQQMAEFRDTQTVAYVRTLGQQLSRVAPGPKYPYRFSVVDYREINAFALPGGPIWIHRGVLQAATTEAQVAGVLAHEIAHVAQRHAADHLTKAMIANWGLSVLGAVLGNTGGAGSAQMAAGLLANGVFLKFSRDDEREADEVGLQIVRRAGWDARGMVELFETLRKEQRRDPGSVEVFFSSHPSPQDRIARLQAAIGKRTAGRRDSRQFQAIRARLLKMPAAKAMPRG